MTKHNKKRNVGIIYELFLKHMSSCLIAGDIPKVKKAAAIIEKRFAKGTELYKEFRLFNALAQTTASDTHIVASILSEAKSAARNCNVQKLNKEKSALIRDINYKIQDENFYYRSIENYRDLATIQVMLNEWRNKESGNIQKLIEFESKVGELLLREKKKVDIDEESTRLKASDSNRLIFKIMTEKMNTKYGSDLTQSQKEIIRNYALYSGKDNKRLVEYLKNKKEEAISLLENFEDKENNRILIEKVDYVRSKITNMDTSKIDDDSIVRFLTVTKLISELSQPE